MRLFERWAETPELLMEEVVTDLTTGTFEGIDGLSDRVMNSLRDVAEGRWPGVDQDIYNFGHGVRVLANIPSNRDEIPKIIGWSLAIDDKIVVK